MAIPPIIKAYTQGMIGKVPGLGELLLPELVEFVLEESTGRALASGKTKAKTKGVMIVMIKERKS